MKHISTAVVAGVFLSVPIPALAQTEIPDQVIEECNAANDASELPKCLKEGAIAFNSIEAAASDDFYGRSAMPVIDACRQRNDSIRTTWICFDEAARAAVETRDLVGIENIDDECIADISSSKIYSALDAFYTSRREARFPDEMFRPTERYYPFQGCQQEDSEG